MVATVFFGLALGWFRFFRFGNAVYASDSLDRDLRSDGGLLVSLVFVFIFMGLLAFLFVPSPTASFQSLLGEGQWPQVKFSPTNFKYLAAGVISGEILRGLYILEEDEENLGPADSFREFIHRWRPSVFAKDNMSQDFDLVTLAGIEFCCWAYGTETDIKLRVLKSLGRDFKISRSQRLNILREMDRHAGRRNVLPKSLRTLSRHFGNDYEARRRFLQKVANVGKRSGFTLNQVEKALKPAAEAIGLTRDDYNSVLNNAGRVKSEYNKANQEKKYKQDRYWKPPEPEPMAAHSRRPSERDKYLKILGLVPGTSRKDIRAAYRNLAKTYHPDRVQAGGSNAAQLARATQKMSQINMAYEWLLKNG